jgi:hypothetical protein
VATVRAVGDQYGLKFEWWAEKRHQVTEAFQQQTYRGRLRLPPPDGGHQIYGYMEGPTNFRYR